MKIIVLAMLVTLTAGGSSPLPAMGAKLLTRPQILNIIRTVNSVNLYGAQGLPSNAEEVASLVNARFNELVDAAALITAIRRAEDGKRRVRIEDYTQLTYEKAIEQLYEEKVLTPQLLEGLASAESGYYYPHMMP